MPRNTRPLRYRYDYQVNRDTPDMKFIDISSFFVQVNAQKALAASGVGAATGATGDINFFTYGPLNCEYHIKGAGETIVSPVVDFTSPVGLDIALDKTDNEGAEYVPGMNQTTSPYAYTVGTSQNAMLRARFKIADVSGTDEFLVGWRKQQAYQTAHTSYTDYAAIGIVTSANPADVQTKTRLNTGTAATTDTLFNWADTEVHELEVRVINGVASYLINGVALGGTISKDGDGAAITAQATTPSPVFTFDSTDVLIPFIYYLHATTSPGVVALRKLTVGPMVNAGLDPYQEIAR